MRRRDEEVTGVGQEADEYDRQEEGSYGCGKDVSEKYNAYVLCGERPRLAYEGHRKGARGCLVLDVRLIARPS